MSAIGVFLSGFVKEIPRRILLRFGNGLGDDLNKKKLVT